MCRPEIKKKVLLVSTSEKDEAYSLHDCLELF